MTEDERLPEINVDPLSNYIIHDVRGSLSHDPKGDKFFLTTDQGVISLAFKRETLKVKARLLEERRELVKIKGWGIGDDDLFYFVCVESLTAVGSLGKPPHLFLTQTDDH